MAETTQKMDLHAPASKGELAQVLALIGNVIALTVKDTDPAKQSLLDHVKQLQDGITRGG